MKLPFSPPPLDFSTGGARIPGVTVRAVLVLAGAVLSVITYGVGGWTGFGVALSLLAAWLPRYLVGWGLILFLAAGRLAQHPALSWQFLVLLAGLHLLHVLATLTVELPWRSWVQPSVLTAPLRRFVAIQIPTQLLAVAVLLLLAPGHGGHRPLALAAVGLVGVVALLGVTLLLFGLRVED